MGTKIMTLKQAHETYGVSIKQLRRMIQRNEIKHTYDGWQYYVSVAELERKYVP